MWNVLIYVILLGTICCAEKKNYVTGTGNTHPANRNYTDAKPGTDKKAADAQKNKEKKAGRFYAQNINDVRDDDLPEDYWALEKDLYSLVPDTMYFEKRSKKLKPKYNRKPNYQYMYADTDTMPMGYLKNNNFNKKNQGLGTGFMGAAHLLKQKKQSKKSKNLDYMYSEYPYNVPEFSLFMKNKKSDKNVKRAKDFAYLDADADDFNPALYQTKPKSKVYLNNYINAPNMYSDVETDAFRLKNNKNSKNKFKGFQYVYADPEILIPSQDILPPFGKKQKWANKFKNLQNLDTDLDSTLYYQQPLQKMKSYKSKTYIPGMSPAVPITKKKDRESFLKSFNNAADDDTYIYMYDDPQLSSTLYKKKDGFSSNKKRENFQYMDMNNANQGSYKSRLRETSN